jgi:glucosyl-3-phosphoglycerate synthase
MTDFIQSGLITTLHDLGAIPGERLDALLQKQTHDYPVGLILPVTAHDMGQPPFATIVEELAKVDYLRRIVIVLDQAPEIEQYLHARHLAITLGDRARVLWTHSDRVRDLYETLMEAGLNIPRCGKGRAVWTAFGYLLGDTSLKAFAVHDCDIISYESEMVARLCLPLIHPSLDFEFCKAYYARYTDRMHARIARLLVAPLLRALIAMRGYHPFLVYLNSFRYPLAGEFGVQSTLARAIRIPGDWGLEIGTLAEVFRNTSMKRVCQVDLCQQYEHKHQSLSLDDPTRGLMKMSGDILSAMFRTLSSMGMGFADGDFVTLQLAYRRAAQDAIRQYRADALMNGLKYDQNEEEQAVEGITRQIVAAGDGYVTDPSLGEELPNWSRVLSAFPEFPQALEAAVKADADIPAATELISRGAA